LPQRKSVIVITTVDPLSKKMNEVAMEGEPALPEHAGEGGADRAADPAAPARRRTVLAEARRFAASVWDTGVRLWLVGWTWLGLGRSTARRLARITDPQRFVALALAPASRTLALAIAFLPRSRRSEAAIAVLAARALVALRRLADPRTARDLVSAAIAYLADEDAARRAAPEFQIRLAPCSDEQRPAAEPDRLDAVLAVQIPVLRAALEALPNDARWRCRDAIDRIGEGTLHVRGDRPGQGRAYVEAVVYAARLAAPEARAPLAACKAAGRGLRFARYLDGGADRDVVLDRALPALAFVPRLFRWLPSTTDPGIRAAATYATLTALPLSARAFGVALPRRLRHPLRAALAAGWSRRNFLATADALEAMLQATRRALAERFDGTAAADAATAGPPDAAAADAALISLAIELSQAPAEPTGAQPAERRSGPLAPACDRTN
jgi:hypothetical protein